MTYRLLLLATLVAAAVPTGCDDTTAPEPPVEYEIEVSGETFTVRAETQDEVDGLEARLALDSVGMVLGTLAAGDGGFNQPWSWHLVPGTVETLDATNALCDGLPSDVERARDYWIDVIGQFCPWEARVARRLD